jgi:hypothetical protein
MTELRGEWRKMICQSCGLILICWNQSRMFEIFVLKWFNTVSQDSLNRSSECLRLYCTCIYQSTHCHISEDSASYLLVCESHMLLKLVSFICSTFLHHLLDVISVT